MNLNYLKQKINLDFLGQDPINRLVFFISSLACLAVIPLLIVRFLEKNWPMVVLDTILVLVLFVIAITSSIAKYPGVARIGLGTVLILGMTLTTGFGTASSVFWIYPSVIAIFFLFQPKWALFSTLCVCATVFPFLNERMIMKDWLIFYVTLLPTMFFVYFFSKALRQQTNELSSLANQDYLTRAGNRRAFNLKAEACIHNKQAKAQHSILVMFDLDNFKLLNDSHGHVVGDEVLKSVVSISGHCLRDTDEIYRLGGEEFGIILHSEKIAEAIAIAERIRQKIASSYNEKLPKYTVSIGISEIQSADNVDTWMSRADEALYTSKRNGRDQINCA